MFVRTFSINDKSACENIWRLSFGDSEEYIKYFFDCIAERGKSFVCVQGEVVIGYVSVFSFESDINDKTAVCNYIYGLCVHPDFRRMGAMSLLLNKVLSEFDGFFALIPAVNGVYEKFGFSVMQKKHVFSVENQSADMVECYDIHHLNSIYDAFRTGFEISLRRPVYWWDFVIKSATDDGYKIIANDGAYAFVKDGKISEFAYVSDFYKDTLPVGRAEVCLPEVMMYGLDDCSSSYFALLLD